MAESEAIAGLTLTICFATLAAYRPRLVTLQFSLAAGQANREVSKIVVWVFGRTYQPVRDLMTRYHQSYMGRWCNSYSITCHGKEIILNFVSSVSSRRSAPPLALSPFGNLYHVLAKYVFIRK